MVGWNLCCWISAYSVYMHAYLWRWWRRTFNFFFLLKRKMTFLWVPTLWAFSVSDVTVVVWTKSKYNPLLNSKLILILPEVVNIFHLLNCCSSVNILKGCKTESTWSRCACWLLEKPGVWVEPDNWHNIGICGASLVVPNKCHANMCLGFFSLEVASK